ncbi:hypothetical protein ACLMJK_008235 [Lecanora helva]
MTADVSLALTYRSKRQIGPSEFSFQNPGQVFLSFSRMSASKERVALPIIKLPDIPDFKEAAKLSKDPDTLLTAWNVTLNDLISLTIPSRSNFYVLWNEVATTLNDNLGKWALPIFERLEWFYLTRKSSPEDERGWAELEECEKPSQIVTSDQKMQVLNTVDPGFDII